MKKKIMEKVGENDPEEGGNELFEKEKSNDVKLKKFNV